MYVIKSRTLSCLHRSIASRIIYIRKTSSTPLSFPVYNDRPTSFYVCGPTVYDEAHIGHARTYICFDIIRRVLTDYFKLNINFSMGVTDIDDKIIARARISGNLADISKLTRELEGKFFEDMDSLNVLRPDIVLRVSEHVDEIISYIQQIEANGFTYLTKDGLYFHIPKLGNAYGKLCNIPSAPRSSIKNPDKKDQRDFALWKAVKADEPSWNSPWGAGRPGWHIECSAMIHSVFGQQLDVHGGGVDLRFPHHTNEIAQCEAHNGHEGWVQRWMHTGHLHIAGRKMSKSLKNFITIREYLQHADYSPVPAEDFRLFCLLNHYTSTLHFSEDRVVEAGAYRRRVVAFLVQVEALEKRERKAELTVGRDGGGDGNGELSHASGVPADPATNQQQHPSTMTRRSRPTEESTNLLHLLHQSRSAVRSALADDFDTSRALRILADLMTATSRLAVQAETDGRQPLHPLIAVRDYVLDVLCMFGLPWHSRGHGLSNHTAAESLELSAVHDKTVEALVAFRESVRSKALGAVKALGAASKSKTKTKANEGHDSATSPAAVAGKEALTALKDILRECDVVRDEVAPRIGITIRDMTVVPPK